MFHPTSNSRFSNFVLNKHRSFSLFSFFALTLLFATHAAHAATIKTFSAKYEVQAFDIKLGTSVQTLECNGQECTLTAKAKPSGLASMFINEATEEVIHLKQTDNELIWQSYQKTTHTNSKTPEILKTVKFVKTETDPVQVHYVEKDRFWPLHSKLFDMVSMAYALQYAKLNQQPLNNFYLQDTGAQDAVTVEPYGEAENLELADLETSVESEQYRFETSKAKVKIWLLPRYDYFPGRIDVYNIESEKTITLILEELPKPL
ncbi:DUF3108 domain-containing protein [Thiomicrorhabdus sp.]|uniref:DUF3108 domain-containing protein n=1 Tax=Thiomicrorhabdus sp. TaxID=2039724 RepID=UPI003565C178